MAIKTMQQLTVMNLVFLCRSGSRTMSAIPKSKLMNATDIMPFDIPRRGIKINPAIKDPRILPIVFMKYTLPTLYPNLSVFCVYILHIRGKLIPINKAGKKIITKESSNPGKIIRNAGISNIFLIENSKVGSSFRKRTIVIVYTPITI
ncbi:hypothetical protein ES703_99560 [subsurface metagenome]